MIWVLGWSGSQVSAVMYPSRISVMMPLVMRTETWCCGCSPGTAMRVPQWRIVLSDPAAPAVAGSVVMIAVAMNAWIERISDSFW